MGVYKEGKNWKVQVYYKDWQGNRKRKQKRGFRTKGEAKEWERDFLQQQSQGVDIEFGNFLEIYYKDMDVRLRENTMYTKRYIIDLKIKPYFEKKILSEITVADVRAWQNELLTYKDKNGKGYSPTYLKTVNCQLTAIFNYAMRYYNLQDNPCRKAGAIGKSKGEPKDFWMQEEFNAFLETVSDKPETRMAFLLLYWTGMRIGELLALTYNDINLEEKTISINKSYQRLKGKDMITQPKTPKSIRVITMPDFLAEEFREYCSHLYGIMKKERLFRFTKSHMEHCMAKAVNCLKELDQEKGIGLIEKRRIGLGKTNVIYVKNFSLTEYPDEPAIFDSEETPENVAERKENTETEIEEYAKKEPEKPVNTQKFEKQTSGSLKNKLQEVSKTNFKEFEKQTSRSLENKLQEVSKTNCNNTEYNYTEFSENESYQYLSEQEKGRDRIQERNEYRQLIHDNIEYEILCQSYGTGRVEELVELMLDAICSTKTYQQINGEAVPTQVVKSRLLKVGYEHIQYVFFSLDRSTSKVKNIRQYMLTVLYNAPATINQFYDAEVRHDMYWGKDIPDR